MSGLSLLALDLGTTGVRALAATPEGAVLGRAYRPLATRYPLPGRVEQDPLALWEASRQVLRDALAAAGLAARDVAAVGVVTQRATALAWDRVSGEPLAPALGWQDQRTAARAAELRAAGIPIGTLPSATKLEWWLEHEPAVRAAAERGRLALGTPDAWLTFRLCGGAVHVTDPGQASCTALFDLGAWRWSAAALALFSLDEAWLPRVVPTCAVVGETPHDLLGAPVPVAARAGDQQAAAFGQGARDRGDAKLTLGTAAMLDVHSGPEPQRAAAGAFPLALWQLADGERACCVEASVLTAGAAVDWLASVGILPAPGQLDELAARVPDAAGVAFVPALQGLGTPFLDEDARGLLGGLTRGSGAAHVARAAIDGIAQRCVDLCDALELDARPLRVDGGLARSALLCQRIADLGGRALLRAAETETTGLGAALLAGVGAGVLDARAARGAAPSAPVRFEPGIDAASRAGERAHWRRVVERAMR